MTRLILVRHGESNATVRRSIGGPRTCDGLSDLGLAQAERLRDRLAAPGEITADALYSSNYPRARETAEVIAPALGLPVLLDDEWGEHDPGPDSDGLTFEEFVARNGMPDWEADVDAELFPVGGDGAAVPRSHRRALRRALAATTAAASSSCATAG